MFLMSKFDIVNEAIMNMFLFNNTWVIRKNSSTLNIESCNGDAIQDNSTHTCELCVAL